GALGAGLIQVLAIGPPERGGGQLDLAAGGLERHDVLHAALAVTALADDDRPVMVLQAGADDLAATGAAAVDQADHREAQIAAVVLAAVGMFLADARLDGHDQAVVDEQIGDFDGALEQAAW